MPSLVDIEPLVDRLPSSRALAPASAFPPALTEATQPDAPAGPTVDPRHAALAALLVVEQRGETEAGSLRKEARTLLSALDLLGGAWLASVPVPDVRSVADSLLFRDEVVEALTPLCAGDAEAASWLELVAESARSSGARWLSYDLRIVAKVATLLSARLPEAMPPESGERLARAACSAALACERSVTWSEGHHERIVRDNVHRSWEGFLAVVEQHVRRVRAVRSRGYEQTLAAWSRKNGPADPEVVVPATRKPLDASIDASSASTFWEGFTDGGSAGGVFVATYGQRRVDERVTVELRIDGSSPHRALGIVRWTRAAASNVKPGLGIELVDASPSLEAKIRAFTRRRAPLRLF